MNLVKKSKNEEQPSKYTRFDPIGDYMMGMEEAISVGNEGTYKSILYLHFHWLILETKPKRKFQCDHCKLDIFNSNANRNAHAFRCKARKGTHIIPANNVYISIISARKDELVEKKADQAAPELLPIVTEKPKEDDKDPIEKMDHEMPPITEAEAQMPKIELKETYGYLMIPCKINFTE